MSRHFELLLFSTDTTFVREAVRAGVDALVVDWERLGKRERQASADTQIGTDTLDDLIRVRSSTQATVICRVNSFSQRSRREIDSAIEAGADEILLPMVRSVSDVTGALDITRSRCGVGILVETVAALGILEPLSRLPLARVYVGLNDLAIERRTPSIFTAVTDGTVDNIRKAVRVPFGFGGLTLPDRGYPVPCRLLIGEIVRLKCDFSLLRRSFLRDIQGEDIAKEIPRLRQAIEDASGRSDDAVNADRFTFEKFVRSCSTPSAEAPSLDD